jgi:hypothetical protein
MGVGFGVQTPFSLVSLLIKLVRKQKSRRQVLQLSITKNQFYTKKHLSKEKRRQVERRDIFKSIFPE